MKDFWLKMKESFKHHWGEFIKEGKTCVNEFKNPQTRKKQIPNLFTASRLFAPFFIIPTALSGNLPLTAIFVTTFALTDAADGYFARKYNATSEFGRKLDALTDKLFAASLLFPLIPTNPALLTVLTMEAVISGINVYSQLSDNTPKTEFIGKIKTVALSGTIVLNYVAMLTSINPIFLDIAMYSTVTLQMVSAAKYLDVVATKEREKGEAEYQHSITIEQNDNGEDKKVKSLTLGESTPIIIEEQKKVTSENDLSISEQTRQLKEYREQLLHPASSIDISESIEAVQLKIGQKK